MSKEILEFSKYARKVSDDARRYAQELIKENTKLRKLLELKPDFQHVETSNKAEKIEQALYELSLKVETLEKEKVHLRDQLDNIKKENRKLQQDKSHLLDQIQEIEVENSNLAENFVNLEQQINNLANLYVSSYQLHGTFVRQEILAAINETIINLIGSEKFGIYEKDSDDSILHLITSFGIDHDIYDTISLGDGIIGRTVETGERYISNGNSITVQVNDGLKPSELTKEHVIACIPMQIMNEVVGVIVIFSLLQQKKGLEDIDLELFDLLSSHAPMALYAAKLHNHIISEN